MNPVALLSSGMITGVGLNSRASCAAIRCAVDRFAETRFMDRRGEWIVGSQVPLVPPDRGREKILRFAVSSIGQCLAELPEGMSHGVPLILCLPEADRPGRIADLDGQLIQDIETRLDFRFHTASSVIADGRVGGVKAIVLASELIEQECNYCIVAGVDSFLVARTLAAYEGRRRLLTSENSNGFIPGEAGAALLLAAAGHHPGPELRLQGIGFAEETATIESDKPLRSDGLSTAILAAFADAGCGFDEVDYRMTDLNGEQYAFREASLAIARKMRVLKPEFEVWHPADCIGEIGSAIAPCALGVVHAAALKQYAPGAGVLAHFGNDDGKRAAIVARFTNGEG